MSSVQYALNLYINSATTDQEADPQPAPPVWFITSPFPAGALWYKVWRWEWEVNDSNSFQGWYAPGNRVLILSKSAKEASLSIRIFDINLDTDGSGPPISNYALCSFLVYFQLTYPAQVQIPEFFTNIEPTGVTVFNSPPPLSTNSVEAVYMTETPPKLSSLIQTICPGAEQAAVWQITGNFGDIHKNTKCDVSVWLQMQNANGDDIFFYKDPEMQMDQSNK